MKKKIYTLAILASVLFVSCNSKLNDDIDDLVAANEALQSELDDVSSDLDDTNQTIDDSVISAIKGVKYSHDYSYNADNPILEEGTIFGSSYQTAYIEETSTSNEYDVNIYVDNDNDYISIYFNYNTTTGEVDLSYFTYTQDDNIYGDYVYMYDNENQSSITTTLTVNSFNAATGEISLTLVADYTAAYSYSEYDTAGELTLNFDDTVQVRQQEPSSSNDAVVIDKIHQALSSAQ